MSYVRKHKVQRQGPVMTALGDLASTITGLASAVGVATDLANDPYLPEVVCRVGQLKAINANQRPGVCVTSRAGMPGGVGLRKLMPGLRGYVYAEQHKWAYALGALVVVGIPFAIGYAAGRSK